MFARFREAVALWRRLLRGEERHFGPLDFSQSVNVILVTFGALVAVSLSDFFDDTKNKLPEEVRFWAIIALLALLLRFIVGSAVHLNRTYNPNARKEHYRDSPSIQRFLKDLIFLIAFGIVAIHITHSGAFAHFAQQSALFVAISLLWSLIDAALHWRGRLSGEPPFYMIWVPLDLVQLAATIYLYGWRHEPHLAAIWLAGVYVVFFWIDVWLTIRADALHPVNEPSRANPRRQLDDLPPA
jgi:hypothetical protein